MEAQPVVVAAPLQGTVVAVAVGPGDRVEPGQDLVVIEAMKLEHGVPASVGGIVRSLAVVVGQTVDAGQLLAVVDAVPLPASDGERPEPPPATAAGRSTALAAVDARHALGLDEARPAAVAR